MTLSYTLHLRLAVPDFLSEPWHAEFSQAMDSIDQAIYNALIAANTSLWLNSTTYAVGDIVINPQTGQLFTVAVAHTTAASPTTFAAYLAANPTFYLSFALSLATQAEAEAGVENTKYMSALRVAQAVAALSPVPGIASQAQAEAGVDNTTMMTPLRTSQLLALRAGLAPQGRLTFQTDTPVMTTTQVGLNIYYPPYIGQLCPVYNGLTFDIIDFWGQLVALTTSTAKNPAAIGASKVNDWFIWVDSSVVTISIASPGEVTYTGHGLAAGNPVRFTTTDTLPIGISPDTTYYVIAAGLTANVFRIATSVGGAAINTSGTQAGVHTLTMRRLTHGPDWTSDTVRSAGTALVFVKGIPLNAVAITNGPAVQRGTYLGTTRSDGSSQMSWTIPGIAAGGSLGWFGVWNLYNAEPVAGMCGETADTWTYTIAAFRQANAAANMRQFFVVGLDLRTFQAEYCGQMYVATSASVAYVGVGFDSSTVLSGSSGAGYNSGSLAIVNAVGKTSRYPGIGFHSVTAIEWGATGGTVQFAGDAGSPGVQQTGLHFSFRM